MIVSFGLPPSAPSSSREGGSQERDTDVLVTVPFTTTRFRGGKGDSGWMGGTGGEGERKG